MSKEERKRKLDQLRRSRIADSRVNQGSNSSPGGGLINLDIAATGVSGVAVAADEEEGRCLTMTASLAQHSILKKKKRRKSIVAVSSSAALDGEKLG